MNNKAFTRFDGRWHHWVLSIPGSTDNGDGALLYINGINISYSY